MSKVGCKILLIFATSIALSSAQAFTDLKVHQLLSDTKTQVTKLATDSARLEALQSFKDKLHIRLAELSLASVDASKNDGPRFSEIASLSEFEVYVDQIKFNRRISGQSCYEISKKINFMKSTGVQNSSMPISTEAVQALDLLDIFCKGRR